MSFIAVPDFLRPGLLMMIGIKDASSGKQVFNSSATGIEFKGKSFSESIGNGVDSTSTSSRTGITGEVRGRGRGMEYGLGRVSSLGMG